MTVTDDERRKVAARLRDFEQLRELFTESNICAFEVALGVGYMDWEHICACLADLIDPDTDMCRVCEHTDENRAAYDGPANRYPAPCPSREALMDEITDCIQACANLAAMVGVSDLTPYMERCEERNRERGRYGD